MLYFVIFALRNIAKCLLYVDMFALRNIAKLLLYVCMFALICIAKPVLDFDIFQANLNLTLPIGMTSV